MSTKTKGTQMKKKRTPLGLAIAAEFLSEMRHAGFDHADILKLEKSWWKLRDNNGVLLSRYRREVKK